MEFQAVVMAAGQGSRMTELTAGCPKCLLPVGGVPMIYYPLKLLENAKFQDVIIVVPDSEENEIRKALVGLTAMKLEFVPIPASEEWGTADSLRLIAKDIKKDILVLSCDLITEFPLYQLADVHRTHDSSLTMLLSPIPPSLHHAAVPGCETKEKPERDFIGLDPNTGRVLFLNSEADVEEDVSIRMALLKRYPVIKMNSNLMDMHLYIIKPWVVRYLVLNKNILTIKGELLPLLVRKQFHKKVASQSEVHDTQPSITNACIKKDLNDFVELSEISKLIQDSSAWNDHWGDLDEAYHGDKIRCFSYITKDFCLKANTIASYNEANKLVPRNLLPASPVKRSSSVSEIPLINPKAQIGPECIIGTETSIAEKVSIKKSTIGDHCIVEEKVKINNSIIMDRVTIGEGCSIQGCIVCKDAVIGKGSNLSDCIVSKGQKVPPGSKCSKEVIMDENQMIEI